MKNNDLEQYKENIYSILFGAIFGFIFFCFMVTFILV
jgi:hypothetical protein